MFWDKKMSIELHPCTSSLLRACLTIWVSLALVRMGCSFVLSAIFEWFDF